MELRIVMEKIPNEVLYIDGFPVHCTHATV